MTILKRVTQPDTEHQCEALTIGDSPPYRCTTSATATRQGALRRLGWLRSRALRVRWFDGADGPLNRQPIRTLSSFEFCSHNLED